MDKLVNNYEKRINTFVLQMAENPIIIKKDKNKYMTTREALYADTSNKILDKKGFIFSKYKTDKERINDYLEQRKEKLYQRKQNNELNKGKKFIQPLMRFKARTDLERVEETLKDRDALEIEKNIPLNQLTKVTTAHSDYSSSDEDTKTPKKYRFYINNSDKNIKKKKNNYDDEEEKKKYYIIKY